MATSATPTWSRSISAALFRQITFGAREASAEVPGWRVVVTAVLEPAVEFRWEVRPTHADGALFFHGTSDKLDEACKEACCSLEICSPSSTAPISGRALHARIDDLLMRGPEATRQKRVR